jgi:hypothetical protein
MSYLSDTMEDIKSNRYMRTVLALDANDQFASFKLDQLENSLREIEWEKKAIWKNKFRGQFNRKLDDDTILANMEKATPKFDADDGLVFARQLEEIDPRLFEVIKTPLEQWKKLLPIKAFTPGLEKMTYTVRDLTGEAELSTPANRTQMAIADATAKQASNDVHVWNLGYEYTAAELRRAAYANVALSRDKIMSVERGYKSKIQKVMFSGQADINLEGIFNHTGVTNVEASAPATGSIKTWQEGTDKTPDEIASEIAGMATDIAVKTDGEWGFSGITVAMPIAQFKYIGTKRMEAGTDTTILQYLKQNSDANGISEFIPIAQMDDKGTGSTGLAIAYPKDANVLEAQIAESIIWLPMVFQGQVFTFGSQMEYGGVAVRYPMAMTQIYGV